MSQYLHGHHESVLRSHRSRTAANSAAYLRPHLRPGQRLLDVGSGPGTITADLAEIVGPTGVTAVEVSEDVLALTRAELERRGLAGVSLVVADVMALPFDDASFDVTHAHQVLQHLPDPVGALGEMARVTKPGGLIAARDSDYAAFTWHPDSPGLESWLALYRGIAQDLGAQPDAGRYYRAWAREAGLEETTITVSTWCYADPESVAWWGGLWAERAVDSDFATRAGARGVPEADLRALASAWRAWAEHPDAYFAIPSTELLAVRH